MSEPPENESDAPSSPGPEPDPPAEPARDVDAQPATADAAPGDAEAAEALKAEPSDDAKPAEPAPGDDAKPAVIEALSEAAAPSKKKATKKKKRKKSAKAAPPKGEAEEEPAKRGKADKEEEPPKPIPGAGTPDGEKLARAVQAFDAGNYALVRTLTTELEQAADADVKEYAKGLRRRIDIDPIQIVVLVACLALFLVIAYVYVLE